MFEINFLLVSDGEVDILKSLNLTGVFSNDSCVATLEMPRWIHYIDLRKGNWKISLADLRYRSSNLPGNKAHTVQMTLVLPTYQWPLTREIFTVGSGGFGFVRFNPKWRPIDFPMLYVNRGGVAVQTPYDLKFAFRFEFDNPKRFKIDMLSCSVLFKRTA